MKAIVGTLSAVLLLSVLAACGGGDDGDDGDPCAEASELFAAAEADFCADEATDCMYCDCLNQGLILDAETLDCRPAPDLNPVNCEGLVKASAEACLADEVACRADATDLAQQTCQAEYLQQDCESDADCKYDTVCTAGSCSLP